MGIGAQGPLGWWGHVCRWRRKQRGADMIVVARVVMIRPGNVMRVAKLGVIGPVIGPVIGLSRHGAGTMFDGKGGGSDGQR